MATPTIATPVEHAPRWLYARVFGSPRAVEGLLAGSLGEVVTALSEASALDRLHLLYYDEPSVHLRLRLCGEPGWIHSVALGRLWACVGPLITAGVVGRMELDTYVPELARYGGARGVELAERIFDADTRAVLALRQAWPDDHDAPPRWRLAAASTDRLVEDLGVPASEREALFGRLAEAREQEFGASPSRRRAIGRRYRALRAQLEPLIAGRGVTPELPPLEAALRRRSARMAPLRRRLDAHTGAADSSPSRAAFIDAVVHLHVNRMLPLAARAQERVLYGLLRRVYASRRARIRRDVAPPPRAPERSPSTVVTSP